MLFGGRRARRLIYIKTCAGNDEFNIFEAGFQSVECHGYVLRGKVGLDILDTFNRPQPSGKDVQAFLRCDIRNMVNTDACVVSETS